LNWKEKHKKVSGWLLVVFVCGGMRKKRLNVNSDILTTISYNFCDNFSFLFFY